MIKQSLAWSHSLEYKYLLFLTYMRSIVRASAELGLSYGVKVTKQLATIHFFFLTLRSYRQ
jgi:hypothetical protein